MENKDLDQTQNQKQIDSDERQIGANYTSAAGLQAPKYPTDGGPGDRLEAADTLPGIMPESIEFLVRDSKNPDREFNSDEFDAHEQQDNKPNNKNQFTKLEAR